MLNIANRFERLIADEFQINSNLKNQIDDNYRTSMITVRNSQNVQSTVKSLHFDGDGNTYATHEYTSLS